VEGRRHDGLAEPGVEAQQALVVDQQQML
jgi:hypothetical protein